MNGQQATGFDEPAQGAPGQQADRAEVIRWLDQDCPAPLVGGKATNLSRMLRAGLPVPNGFVVTTEGYHQLLREHGLAERLRGLVEAGDDQGVRELFDVPLPTALAERVVEAWHLLGGGPVAVRSSATAEDLAEASFAGQQESYLNVDGEQQLCRAVRDCFASLWTERAVAYRARHGVDAEHLALAVVVQKLVPATSSGVLFTANPTNGRADQTVVTAAYGLGEGVVQGGAADTLVLEGGRVVQRETADKPAMTVPAPGGGVAEQPLEPGRRRREVLDDGAAAELAALGGRVAKLFGVPQDLEWVRTPDEGGGEVFVLVQSRPITALGRAVGPEPTDWRVPDQKAMYARASIVEQMPDPLSPLFADMVRPAVVDAVRQVLADYVTADAVHEGDVDFVTVNGYAYYYYSRDGMLRLLRQTPAAVAMVRGRSEYNGEELWQQAHPAYRQVVDGWRHRPLDSLPSQDLLHGVDELLRAGCRYYSAVQALIPLAASAEIPFVRLYTTGARHADDPAATTFLLGYSSRPIQAECSLWELAQWCRTQPELSRVLLAGGEPGDEVPGAVDFRDRLQRHLDRFGHTVYNLDFMVPVPADDPRPVLETLRWYLSGKGEDPNARLARQAAQREKATAELFAHLDPARTRILQPLLAKAQHLAPLREDALADVGLAWPVMRAMLRVLGTRLTDIGVLDGPDDVHWLHRDELDELCTHLDAFAGSLPSRRDELEQRRVTWRGQRLAHPPQLLPHNAWYRMFHRLMPATETRNDGPVVKGLGASQGRITAPVRLVRGPEDFSAMMPGEVLVSPITTPAYTPLFAMAAAVVTDVGGPLSHSSIVAREYDIPAVLGTGIATRRLRTGMLVTVDGDRGEVVLPHGEEPVTTGFTPKVPYKFALGAAALATLVVGRFVR